MSTSSLLCTLLVTGLLTAQDPAPKPKPPAPATPVKLGLGDALPKTLALHDLDGKPYRLGDYRDKVLVLHFWSSTCPWEVEAEPKINAFATDYAKQDVAVFGIAANLNEIGKKPAADAFRAKKAEDRPYPKLRAKAKASELNHPVLVDHGAVVGKLLDGKTTPHLFVFDKKGLLVYSGALDDDGRAKQPERAANYLRSAVDAVLAGEEVGVATTKPYG